MGLSVYFALRSLTEVNALESVKRILAVSSY